MTRRLSIHRVTKAFVIALVLTEPLLGCLRAAQTERSASPAAPKTVTQQLTELLEPVKVQVAPSAMAPNDSAGTRELRVRWTAGGVTASSTQPLKGPPPAGSFSISEQRHYAEAAPRQRSLDLGPGRLLMAAVDRSGRLKSWIVILDPRIVRSEGPGPDGTLTGETLHLGQAEFFLSVPDDPEIVELRLFESQSSGQT